MAKGNITVNVKIRWMTRILLEAFFLCFKPMRKTKKRILLHYTKWLEKNSYLKECVTNQNGLIDEYMGEK